MSTMVEDELKEELGHVKIGGVKLSDEAKEILVALAAGFQKAAGEPPVSDGDNTFLALRMLITATERAEEDLEGKTTTSQEIASVIAGHFSEAIVRLAEVRAQQEARQAQKQLGGGAEPQKLTNTMSLDTMKTALSIRLRPVGSSELRDFMTGLAVTAHDSGLDGAAVLSAVDESLAAHIRATEAGPPHNPEKAMGESLMFGLNSIAAEKQLAGWAAQETSGRKQGQGRY